MKRTIALAAAAGLVTLAVAACSSPRAATATAWSSQSAAHAATVKACRDLAAWVNGSSTAPFGATAQTRAIWNESAGTPLAGDLGAWILAGSVLAKGEDEVQIQADCKAAGVAVGNG